MITRSKKYKLPPIEIPKQNYKSKKKSKTLKNIKKKKPNSAIYADRHLPVLTPTAKLSGPILHHLNTLSSPTTSDDGLYSKRLGSVTGVEQDHLFQYCTPIASPTTPILTRHMANLKKSIMDDHQYKSNRNSESLTCLEPERVLDAPCLRDDFYLGILDWSLLNVLAVGLDNIVYLWNEVIYFYNSYNFKQKDEWTSGRILFN